MAVGWTRDRLVHTPAGLELLTILSRARDCSLIFVMIFSGPDRTWRLLCLEVGNSQETAAGAHR